MSQRNHGSSSNRDIPVAMFADCLANSKEIFDLIDKVFPVDSCRHYQVLPLSLRGSDLTLGMIDAQNEESFKFVTSIAKVFKYNLQLKLIEDQTLQIILASYPQNSQQYQQSQQARDRNKTIIDATVIDDDFAPQPAPQRKMADSTPTIISQSEERSIKSDNDDGFEGLPPDLDFLKDIELTPKKNSPSPQGIADKTATLYEIPPEFLQQPAANNLDDKQTVIAENPQELLAQEEAEIALAEAQISDLIAEVAGQIQPKPKEQLESVDFLATLDSNLSWHKLLEKAFEYQSDEINLTRHSDFGSIVAENNKSLQSQIKQVPLPIFCSLIDEIKRMAKIPLDLSNHPKKVVLERFYQEERILLRLAFSQENEAENVMVKIFRGDNLKVYEQQQMDKVSEQALYLARQLEKTLRRIQACFDTAEFKQIRELQTVQSRINHQLRLLDKK